MWSSDSCFKVEPKTSVISPTYHYFVISTMPWKHLVKTLLGWAQNILGPPPHFLLELLAPKVPCPLPFLSIGIPPTVGIDSLQAALNGIDFFLGFPIRIVVVRATLVAHWATERDPWAIVGEVVRHPLEGCECLDPMSKEDRGRLEGCRIMYEEPSRSASASDTSRDVSWSEKH
jgi:hypothetical protein